MALRSQHRGMILSLQQIDQLCLNKDRVWWNVLRAVNQFSEFHQAYRSALITCRDACTDSHWTALLIFSAMSKNDRVMNGHIRKLRTQLNCLICSSDPSDEKVDALLSQLTDFSRFSSSILVIELELISKMLNTLFGADVKTRHVN